MKNGAQPLPKTPTHIRDARGARVTQLDPVELHLLHRHDVMDAETLRPIAEAIGSGLEAQVRRFLPLLIVGVIAIGVILLVQVIEFALTGDYRVLFRPRNIALANVWLMVMVFWARAKSGRFGRIRKVMLEHRRCPHCGYDLHGLPPDPTDGATLCPECGSAWMIEPASGAGGD